MRRSSFRTCAIGERRVAPDRVGDRIFRLGQVDRFYGIAVADAPNGYSSESNDSGRERYFHW
jgi:hypothetical protein